jgi:hypothetical protein
VNHQETAQLIAVVIHLWPTVPWRNDEPGPLAVTWQVVLADVTLTEAQAVVVDVARTGAQFPPTPGVIAKTVLDGRDRARGTMVPDADQAWAEVQAGISSHGFVNGPPAWSHPAVEGCVAAITWRELCMSTNADTLRAHFLRMYDTAARRTVAEERSTAAPLFAAIEAASRQGELPRHTPAV